MNYLTVKPEGELHVFEGPDRPRSYCAGKPGCCWNERCKILAYDEAMLTASQSSVICKDQQQARKIICDNYTYFNKPGAFYPLPEGVRVEYHEACGHDCCPVDAGCEHCKEPVKLAILTVGAVEDKQESQEELWEEAESRFIDWHIPEFDIKGLMQEFTITRKGVN